MKKYFLTKKQLNYIIQKYGSGHRWSLHEDMSEHGRIIYMDSLNYMLSVNLLWEGSEGKFPYIGIHLANSTGIIIRRDRYEYCNTDRTRFEFTSTEEYGCFYDEFRPISKPSEIIKCNKSSNARNLEQQLSDARKMLEVTEKRLRALIEQAEQDFLNSPTYHQMQQEIDFYKSLNKLNESHLANAKKQALTITEHIQQVYADNANMCEHEGDLQYWVGITECWHEAKEYEKLREEIRTLKGKVEQKDQAIIERDAEIQRLQMEIGQIKCQPENATILPADTTSIAEVVRIIERNIEQKKSCASKKPGRPPQIDEQKLCLLIELRKKRYSVRHIAEQLGMSVGNVHRYIKLYETEIFNSEEKS